MGDIVENWIQWLLKITQLDGFSILLVSAPLAIIQGLLGIFPFATLIVLNISVLGLGVGLFVSWLLGTFVAIVAFSVFRYFFFQWFVRRWGERLRRYEKWQNYIDIYGVWVIIFLRTLPIMPNNLISLMSAVSPIKLSRYIWSSIIGNLSHIWLFGIISSSIIMPGKDISGLLYSYVAFCFILITTFITIHYKSLRNRKGTM